MSSSSHASFPLRRIRETLVVFRPEVEICIYGPRGSKVLERRFVDTGSDNMVFPGYVARELGIPVTRVAGPAAQAFGGHEVGLSYADVESNLSMQSKVFAGIRKSSFSLKTRSRRR